MRIWLVPFKELDDRRLVAQHHEWHGIVNTIFVRGWRWKGWEKPEYRADLLGRHAEVLQEFEIRDFKHGPDSETHTHPDLGTYPIANPPKSFREYPRPLEVLDLERWTLMCRWEGVFKGRGSDDPLTWGRLAGRYDAHGCLHDGPWEEMSRTPETGRRNYLCLICKRYTRREGDGRETHQGGEEAQAASTGGSTTHA